MAKITCSKCGKTEEYTCSQCGCPNYKSNNDGGILGALKGTSKTIRCKNCGVIYPANMYCECGKNNPVPTKLF